MVSSINNNSKNGNETLVFDHKLSSVGPGKISGNNTIYNPNNIDLAMKLHYLKFVYFLDTQASEGLTLRKIKESTFSFFNYYYESCGRFRRSDENGRPYIKCNDCGVRFIEAKTSKTMEEWLTMEETCAQKFLLPQHHVIGPELTFSPLLFLQVTFFKCGGISLGLSWAHVLGDAFSVANFMNTLAQVLSGNLPNHPPFIKKSPPNFEKPIKEVNSSPLSIRNVGPIGDLWAYSASSDFETFSFLVAQDKLARLQSKITERDQFSVQIQPFEAVCAVIWQVIAKAGVGPRPDVVTVLRKDATYPPQDDEMSLRNTQTVSTIKADFSVEEAQVKDLAVLIRDWAQDERAQIGEMVDRDPGASDFIVYGSKLTFVDLEEANFYGFQVKGLCPKFVNCFVDGIGEEGVVLVLPCPKNEGNDGRIVTLIMPSNYMAILKDELKNAWDIIA